MTAQPATGQPQRRSAWRASWRAAEHEQAVRGALAAGHPLLALACACGAVRSEAKKRWRRNRRTGALICVHLAANLLVTANGLPGLKVTGPRGDLTPDRLVAEFDAALDAAAQAEGDPR